VAAPASVYGVKETLATLREIDPALYRAAMAKVKAAAAPMATAISSALPADPPLSGMANRGRLGWKPASRRVVIAVGGRRPRTDTTWPLVRVKVSGAAGQMVDMAGRGSANPLDSSLRKAGHGSPSRWAWPTAEREMPAILTAVRDAIDEVSREASTTLAWKG
jgi:hypothetical protein